MSDNLYENIKKFILEYAPAQPGNMVLNNPFRMLFVTKTGKVENEYFKTVEDMANKYPFDAETLYVSDEYKQMSYQEINEEQRWKTFARLEYSPNGNILKKFNSNFGREPYNLLITKYTNNVKDIMSVQESLTKDAPKTYKPPMAAVNNAKKALAWKEEHGKEVKGGTPVGWSMAKRIAERDEFTLKEVKKIASFKRHKENSVVAPEYKKTPWKDRGYVAYLLWGGNTGIEWALKISENN